MATLKNKPAATAKAADTTIAPELAAPHSAWEAMRPALTAASGVRASDYEVTTITRWVAQECEELAPLLDKICGPLNAAESKRVRTDHAAATQCALAGRYIASQLTTYRVAKDADRKATRDALVKEASGLQATGHAGLVLLTLAGLISEAEAKVIRKGRGALDAAQDCHRMGRLYTEHWSALDPMVKRTRFVDVEPLTLERAERMTEVGDALSNHLQSTTPTFQDAGIDWLHQRAALLATLETAWEPLRLITLYHAARTQDAELGQRLVPLTSMRAHSALYRA